MFVKSVLVFLSVFSALLISVKGTNIYLVPVRTNGSISWEPSETSPNNFTGSFVSIRIPHDSVNCTSGGTKNKTTFNDYNVETRKYLRINEILIKVGINIIFSFKIVPLIQMYLLCILKSKTFPV